jgi:hypothetical protein
MALREHWMLKSLGISRAFVQSRYYHLKGGRET